ncbi:hypothetical protein JOE57_002175 [Microlunatus panaciterrae]|uniref:DUF6299 domain-containing protein n=1 Tax=Microlunatus panaciterrae TaxID=400768 RepID=A0ABS2RJR9_9ACTN|nr:DUF6299 family protein [Microlunatus panaciterrae]MBM7799254.1 hypothetical protein [Microlunatus panaciterrae]
MTGAALLAIVLSIGGLPAMAAPPSNDTIAGAIPVSLGYSATSDTTEATTDATDAQLNETCGAPATDASVWYSLTVPADSGVIVDVSGSSYSAGVIVGVGTPGALTNVACGPGTVAFSATAGTTYYVLAIDYQGDGSGNGGTLSISFSVAPPPPTLSVTVDPRGTFNSKTGVATLRGSYTCTDADYIDVYGDVAQSVGRIATIRGSFDFFEVGTCDGTSHRWTAEVAPYSGKFKGGKALTVAFSYACGVYQCAEGGFAEQTVQLSGGAK